MIRVRKSELSELNAFYEMEKQSHAKEFINASTLEQHQKGFADTNLVYLSIENHKHELVGYFILKISPKTKIVEFRRIIIDQEQQGIGQEAIGKMEIYCRERLNCKKIWLDVYQDNSKGIYIYQKLGYKKFKEAIYNNKTLYFFDKTL